MQRWLPLLLLLLLLLVLVKCRAGQRCFAFQ
jgi:hypothetical protein